MKKLILPIVLSIATVGLLVAQKPKGLPKAANTNNTNINTTKEPLPAREQSVPDVSPVFQQTLQIKSIPMLQKPSMALPEGFDILTADNGVPTMIQGTLPISTSRELPFATRATQYLDAVKGAMQIKNPTEEFEVTRIETDDLGQSHVRLQQKFGGLKVWGGEVIVHERNNVISMMNGVYFPTPSVSELIPSLEKGVAETSVKADLNTKTTFTALNEASKKYIGGEQLRSELIIFHVNDNSTNEKLAWYVIAYPDMLHRYEYFVDAKNGAILESYGTSCNLMSDFHKKHLHTEVCEQNTKPEKSLNPIAEMPMMDGKATANSNDLFDLSRVINTYQVGTKYYLIDASRTMFKPTTSSMPNQPIGVIQTRDYKNTDDGPSSFISSANNTWTDKKGVSAHYNAGKTFEYYLATFGRNSINGQGGNMESFINVTENNKQMDNAFWNGEAMFYGNGTNAVFKDLPKALDVAGHEISHGVIQNTANLRYQSESGAMNESFADVFGAMIDRDDWKMGEDITVISADFPTGALRDLSNPYNGGTSLNNASYQPKLYSERYKGTEDNGGVHINSGITNYAFYLFASNTAVGKDKAEKVYYRALTNYLVASSKFIDLRAAIEQSCKDLYPNDAAILSAAQTAFNTVGIGSGGTTTGTTYQQDIAVNPGLDYIVYVSADKTKLLLTTPSNAQPTILYTGGVASRPSITDDGTLIVFVGTDKHIYSITINWATNSYSKTTLSTDNWNNAAISKDGKKIAANDAVQDSLIWVYSFDLKSWKSFKLYNPTTASGNRKSNEVKYSDALEWDHYGEYVMYDAFNQIPSVDGAVLEYWDVGFVNVWSNTTKNFATGTVEKLFSNLPAKVSIGNPTFAKNSPYVIAFDYIEGSDLLGTKYSILGANTQTRKVTSNQAGIVANNTVGYPSFSRQDNRILYNADVITNGNVTSSQLKTITLAANKIEPSTTTAVIVSDAQQGNWFGNGKRVISSTNELDKSSVKIAPNPFNEVLNIDIKVEKTGKGTIEIFDLLGRMVMQYPLSISAGNNVVSLPTSNLQVGTYLLKVSVDNNTMTSKVVKL
jgi:bacillolysin